ncbi:SH3 domain-containing protein [Brumimicrobium mesophilum]|uniref:SH3 domain-containing protein n=1 Tax=Brumimicrobium mesophilum TaxID=392717 RepID=UPI0018FE1887|nr:SH3 domain-containing protein [Brumimicrobium mesophilum]
MKSLTKIVPFLSYFYEPLNSLILETKHGFTLMDIQEFETWVNSLDIHRNILFIQQHHTWSPSYIHFKENHFTLQKNMKHYHVNQRGWSDIGQHFSTYPDGRICTGRSLELNPACIYGNNNSSICIEHIGNFDQGKDQMTDAQKDVVVRMTAALAKRFNVPINTDRIVYHHWFHLGTGARNNGGPQTTNKTCPGENFFGGNTLAAAENNFIPLVKGLADKTTDELPSKMLYFGVVDVNTRLSVRLGAGTYHSKIDYVENGMVIRIYEEKNNWFRISQNQKRWVYGRFINKIRLARVNVNTKLNVRSGPSSNYPKVASLTKNHEVYVYEIENDWAKIDVEEQWVSEDFLEYLS